MGHAVQQGAFTIPEGVLAIGGRYSFTGEFSPVPEPATLTLLGTIAGLGAIHRLRKRTRARLD